jgi:phage gp46-like protein
MMAIEWNLQAAEGDLARRATGALAEDEGLGTAVLLSLFLDRRAAEDDDLPDAAALDARRGWIGDALAMPGGEDLSDRIGSRLWLLCRAKQLPETLRLAEDYATEALAWLVADGLAADVTVAAEWIATGVMALSVRITPPAGDPATFSFGLRTR